MLTFKCRIVGCAHVIKDGQHVDDVAERLKQHYRAQHPTKAFYINRAFEEIEQFNMGLADYFVSIYGPNWQNRQEQELVGRAQRLLQAGEFYGPGVLKEAEEYVQAAGAAVPAPNADVPPAGAGVDAMWDNIVMPMPVPRFDADADDLDF